MARNNITTITDDNFRGQDGLHELDLSGNKIHRMPSGVFFHLKVSVHTFCYENITWLKMRNVAAFLYKNFSRLPAMIKIFHSVFHTV